MNRSMNLLRALFTVSGMTFISRILGFVREALIARYFGAGMASDAFFVAFKLPNLLRRVFAEGAFSQAFVPILAEFKQQKSETETRRFVSHVHGALALVLLLITSIGMLAAPLVIVLTAPGFTHDPQQFDLAASLLRLTFPYILLISLSSLASGILNTYSQFSIPAFTPTLLNIAFILSIVFIAPHLQQPVYALAIGVLLGGIAQLVFQWPHLAKLGLLTWPRLDFKDAAVWRVVKQMGPAVFSASISQVSLVINTIFATFLAAGSVSWMNYADRLMEFPTGMLGVALGTILLPSLSKHHASNSREAYSALLDWGIRLALLLALPSAVALAVIGEPLTVALYQYGKFSAFDADMTQRALAAYAVGLPGLILLKVLAPGFYARQNIKTPVKVALVTLCATQALNVLLVGLPLWCEKQGWHLPLLTWLAPLKHAGLALSISLAALLNSLMLYHLLRKHGIYTPQAGWHRFWLQLSAGLITMTAFLWTLCHFWHGWASGHLATRLVALLPLIIGGMAVYFGTLWLCGLSPRAFVRRESH